MDFDFEVMESIMNERMRWATLSVKIKEAAAANPDLVKDFSRFEAKSTISILSGLLTLPEYQSNCLRLEVLVALAFISCQGKKQASISDAQRWFHLIGESYCVLGEDPAEDVFVSLVHDEHGNYRILEGVWETAGFYTQNVLDAITDMANKNDRMTQIVTSLRALLKISDIVCQQSGLSQYELGSIVGHSNLLLDKIPGRKGLTSRVLISLEALKAEGFSKEDITPFLFDLNSRSHHLQEQEFGNSNLDLQPLLLCSEKEILVTLPTSLSVAARNFVITHILCEGFEEDFNIALAESYSKLFRYTPILGGPTCVSVTWQKIGTCLTSNLLLEFDRGYYLSFHFFLPSVATHHPGGFKIDYQDDGSISDILQRSVDSSIRKLSERTGFKKGIILLVGCGWGKGLMTQGFVLDNPEWRFKFLSAADFIRLSRLPEMSPNYFWRIQDGLEVVRQSGIQIANPNGELNLIGWIKSNDGHLVPHDQLPNDRISPEKPLNLLIPSNLIRDVRFEADKARDVHRAIDNLGRLHKVQRIKSNPLFESTSEKRLYVSHDDLENGSLTSLYEGDLKLWLSISTPNIQDKDFEYRLWEMANEWLHRIGSIIEKNKAACKADPLKIYLIFQDKDLPKTLRKKPTSSELESLCEVRKHSEKSAFIVNFNEGFLKGASIADNAMERIFVHNMIKAFLNILQYTDIIKQTEKILTHVVLNQEARSFHVFHAHKFIDFVRDTLPDRLVSIDPIDDAALKIGLGWRIIQNDQSSQINGKKACTKFLRELVDNLIADLLNDLSSFERIPLLMALVGNCEKANAEEVHWEKTSAAVIGLHGKNKNTLKRVVEQNSKFAGAAITSRVLIEMALCSSTLESGFKVSNLDLSKLIVKASLIIRIGGLSDAIYYSALPPEINISALGDILFRDDFGKFVVQPMLAKATGEKFTTNAPLQNKNYEEPKFYPSSKSEISDEFWEIWKNEMGFTIDEARHIIEEIENKGITEHKAIFIIPMQKFLDCVVSSVITEKVALAFLKQFTLKPRLKWGKAPKEFSVKDIYPWKFGRRLAFVTRPILALNESDTSPLLIAPNALKNGFSYVVQSAHSGRFDQSFFQSKEMRNSWWGKASEGHTFNKKVTHYLKEKGWIVREGIEIPEIISKKTEKNYGDVDVLAWDKKSEKILVIECKDLSFARNYSEIASLLSEYQGIVKDGKPDSLRKHLNRFAVLEQYFEELKNFTGLDKPTLHSCLICSGIVPMQYSKIDALANTFVGTYESLSETHKLSN